MPSRRRSSQCHRAGRASSSSRTAGRAYVTVGPVQFRRHAKSTPCIGYNQSVVGKARPGLIARARSLSPAHATILNVGHRTGYAARPRLRAIPARAVESSAAARATKWTLALSSELAAQNVYARKFRGRASINEPRRAGGAGRLTRQIS